jgi:hypothetical protein
MGTSVNFNAIRTRVKNKNKKNNKNFKFIKNPTKYNDLQP